MLKLGSETGSVVNHLYSRGTSPEPEVGMGATLLHWTDREPAEVVEVHGPRHIRLRPLKAVRTDKNGMSESQTYEFSSDPEAPLITARRTPKGWLTAARSTKTGRWTTAGGTRVMLGRAEKYHDFSF